MRQTKKLRGDCTHCGMPIDFLAENIGTTAPCPHCRKTTVLFLAQRPDEPLIPRRIIVWTFVTILILLLGFVGTLFALNRAKKMAGEKASPATHSQTTPAK